MGQIHLMKNNTVMRTAHIWRMLNTVLSLWVRVKYGILRRVIVSQLADCGSNVYIDGKNSFFTTHLISIGSDVYVGPGADFGGLTKPIRIGSKVRIGPNVSIRTDNHDISRIGRYMYDVHDRRPEDEGEIVVEDDVWIGTRVIILKGVHIGRGSVIAAGTIVTRSVPPYSIVAGRARGRVLRQRWSDEEIAYHEKLLYGTATRAVTNSRGSE